LSPLQRAAADFTALGSHIVLAFIVLMVAGLLVIRRRDASGLWLIPVTAGAMLLSHGLKALFDRPRPDEVDHLVLVTSPSFPSGHALLSAAVYLSLAAMLGREIPRLALRRYLMALAVLLTLLIGASRVYLGVHWPSDVLGGWVIGSLWAWGCHVALSRAANR
jgi:undecaprenyl-diphosphatase